MNKALFLLLPIAMLGASLGIASRQLSAEPESSEEESIEISSEEESTEAESTEESAIESTEQAPIKELPYLINEATIRFRDSEDGAYALAEGNQIGYYFLSADGWDEDDDFDISMTIKGNVTTKLESKVVYIYEYKPTRVTFNNEVIPQGENRVYTLHKPAEKGAFDLEIAFTKTIITNPVDLTHINWASLLTVQNLMVIGAWVVIVVGIIALYAVNLKYKRRGSTTLEQVKKELTSTIKEEYGVEFANQVGDLFDKVVAPAFSAIDSKLSKMDGNQATLVRCLLLMQENTPEARLAITECLSKLDMSADEDAEKVKQVIAEQQAKTAEAIENRLKALEEAKAKNEKWIEENKEVAKKEENGGADTGYDGTSI